MSSNEQTVRTVTLLTAPHDGSRGTAFLEFERRFKSNMIAEFIGDEDFSAWECCIGMDQGGNGEGAPAMPALNANNRDQLIRKRIKRQAFAYKLVFRHINDPRLRELLNEIGDREDLAQSAWALIKRECEEQMTDLEVLELKERFTAATIMDAVGHSEATITDFARYLATISA